MRGGSETTPYIVSPSVIECATVKVVTCSRIGRSRALSRKDPEHEQDVIEPFRQDVRVAEHAEYCARDRASGSVVGTVPSGRWCSLQFAPPIHSVFAPTVGAANRRAGRDRCTMPYNQRSDRGTGAARGRVSDRSPAAQRVGRPLRVAANIFGRFGRDLACRRRTAPRDR